MVDMSTSNGCQVYIVFHDHYLYPGHIIQIHIHVPTPNSSHHSSSAVSSTSRTSCNHHHHNRAFAASSNGSFKLSLPAKFNFNLSSLILKARGNQASSSGPSSPNSMVVRAWAQRKHIDMPGLVFSRHVGSLDRRKEG